MLSSQHYRLFNEICSEKEDVRNSALSQLHDLEGGDQTSAIDLIGYILQDENPIVHIYIIKALGRLGDLVAVQPLSEIYLTSKNPLILQVVLESCLQLKSDQFAQPIVDRLRGKKVPKGLKYILNSQMDFFDEEMILDQITALGMKTLQVCGTQKSKKDLLPFLDHAEHDVRFQCLKAFDLLKISIDRKKLAKFQGHDLSPYVQKQAELMLEKLD
ncbi:MAG: hypothetical protein ACI86H_002427 [bacterium]|jgi:hypothetical protein